MRKNLVYSLIIGLVLICSKQEVYGQNYWTQKSNFPGNSRMAHAVFTIGNYAYLGLGVDSSFYITQEFWRYDPLTDVWTQVADYGGGKRFWPVSFVIGNEAFVGLGHDTTGISPAYPLHLDFWKYNPTLNNWTQVASFPGAGRLASVGFSSGGKGYIAFGHISGATNYQDTWEYDPILDLWTQKSNSPAVGRQENIALTVGNNAYIGLGFQEPSGGKLDDWWQYDVVSDVWTQKANFGGTARFGCFGFAIGTDLFVGGGVDGSASTYTGTFYGFNTLTNVWTQYATFPGLIREDALGFTLYGKGYIAVGRDGGTCYNDVWKYTPPFGVGIEETSPVLAEIKVINNTLIVEDMILEIDMIAVYSMAGQLVLENTSIKRQTRIEMNLSTLSKGAYTVVVKAGKSKQRQKFIIG